MIRCWWGMQDGLLMPFWTCLGVVALLGLVKRRDCLRKRRWLLNTRRLEWLGIGRRVVFLFGRGPFERSF